MVPDLVGTLAEQIKAFADETLTCALYQLSRSPFGHPSVDLIGHFSRPSHAARGSVEATIYIGENVLLMPPNGVPFAWPCHTQASLRQLLDGVMWNPSWRYFLVLRRLGKDGAGTGAASASASWPPPKRVPTHRPNFGWSEGAGSNTGFANRNRLLNDLYALFPVRHGFLIQILYMEEWEAGEDNPVAFSEYAKAVGWSRRMAAACAEAVYGLLAAE